MRKTVWSLLIVAMITLGSLALTGCGKGLSGKYAGQEHSLTLEFKSGKAYFSGTECSYEVKGGKVTLTPLNGTTPDYPLKFTMKDNTLVMDATGLIFHRQ